MNATSIADLAAWAEQRAAEVEVRRGRMPAAVYRRFFPAAEIFRAKGWSVPRMVEEFVAGGHWDREQADALRQALARHFRAKERREGASRGGAEIAE